MSCCTRVTQLLPDLIATLKEHGLGQWPKLTIHGVSKDEGGIGDIVDTEMTLQKRDRIDWSMLVHEDYVLTMCFSLSMRETKETGLRVTQRPQERSTRREQVWDITR
jgi:hypothetical protein